jgi:cold-inducible RNA-binding protein
MKNLYVGNLPHSTTEGDLRSAFAVDGAVDSVSIITDRDTGQARGFGFVEMTVADAAEKAIAGLNGSDLGGRTIQVNEAKPKADKPRGNGGQRFGGGGRRNGGRGAREQRW